MACFIVSDRALAIRILSGAMNKLKARMGREKKRVYWRDKYMKRWITTVTRGDADTLQWLIYLESEGHEKEQEQSGGVSTRDLIIRYIKSIVRMTTAMSSFHVSVGVSRVLHCYHTSETQRMYDLVSQRYLAADQFRRAKRSLLDKLQARFGRYLKTFRDRHGEIKFERLPDQGRWADLARACLTAFTPWSTTNTCLAQADSPASGAHLPNWLSASPQSKVHYDAIEVNWCHVFIEPACFRRLAEALGLGAPDRKLALPQFFENISAEDDRQPEGRPSNQPLTAEERKMIGENLSAEAGRRRHVSPRSLRILVDAVECARLDLFGACERRVEIVEGARLLEIWSHDRDGELLLATHLISFSERQVFAPVSMHFRLKSAGTLALTISPQAQEAGEARRAFLGLHYAPSSPWFSWKSAQSILRQSPARAAAQALTGVALVAIGWFLAGMKFQRELHSQRIALQQTREQLRTEKATHPSLAQNPAGAGPSPSLASYRLIPDDLSTRGTASAGTPTVFISKGQLLVHLQLPLRNSLKRFYRAALQSFPEQQDILTQRMLTPSQTASGAILTLALPASLLRDDRDYTIVLDWLNSAGKTQEENSFTFHVVKRD